MSIDPRHDVASGGTGLFEFWTDQGVPVYLHDMDLVSVEVRPVDQVVVLRFEYTEARWTPAAAEATPVVVMRFEGVAVRWWNQEAGVLGQVGDFEYDGGDGFKLTTYSAVMEFGAARLVVTAEPGRGRG
ncbi:hypothetical protein [Kribbella sp.]|uniref:hypothetical protein n=1 Tax=Kribbella sp. TaxID=1871183 RepID=UPI002D5811D2|nr:hypothetical protein [Kribbella sp.]HZX07380.1 hypothetical protein [Kribbella sp.]